MKKFGIAIVSLVAAVASSAIAPAIAGASGAIFHRPAEVNVSYGPDATQTIHVYPAAVAGSPLVVMAHGGGWRSSVNVNMEVSTAKQLQAAGFAVFDTNYQGDSSTTAAFPTETNDIASATLYAIQHATTFNGNPAKVAMLGGSSGGQLVAFAAEQLNNSAPGTISSVVTLSGPFDFPLDIAYWSGLSGPTAKQHLDNQLVALGCSSAASCPTALEDAWSPDLHVSPANCPHHYLVVTSTNDEVPVAQANAMTASLRAAGCSAYEAIVPGSKHGFHVFKSVEPFVDAVIAAG